MRLTGPSHWQVENIGSDGGEIMKPQKKKRIKQKSLYFCRTPEAIGRDSLCAGSIAPHAMQRLLII